MAYLHLRDINPEARRTVRRVYRVHRAQGADRATARGEAATVLRMALRSSPRFRAGYLPGGLVDGYGQ